MYVVFREIISINLPLKFVSVYAVNVNVFVPLSPAIIPSQARTHTHTVCFWHCCHCWSLSFSHFTNTNRLPCMVYDIFDISTPSIYLANTTYLATSKAYIDLFVQFFYFHYLPPFILHFLVDALLTQVFIESFIWCKLLI